MHALVEKIRRLNAIVECASNLVRALAREAHDYPEELRLVALVERLETTATGREKSG